MNQFQEEAKLMLEELEDDGSRLKKGVNRKKLIEDIAEEICNALNEVREWVDEQMEMDEDWNIEIKRRTK